MSDPEAIVDLPSSKINPGKMTQQIQERVQARRAAAAAQGLDYDSLVMDADTFNANRLPLEFYKKIKELRDLANLSPVVVAMYDPHLPLVNAWFLRAKGKLHGIIVDYVNRLGKQQAAYNAETESIVNDLTEFLESTLLRIESLEREVVALRQRVAILERTQEDQ